MKKVTILLMSLFVIIGLAACDDGISEEKEVSSVESSDEAKEENAEENEADNTEESESSDYNEVLLDDDIAKVELRGIETKEDDIFGDEHSVKLEIENKSDETIEVQAHEVSIDGVMVDDMVFFSETVAGGKKSNAELSIMALDDDLPELNENLELKLKILDDDFMDVSSTDVSVDIK